MVTQSYFLIEMMRARRIVPCSASLMARFAVDQAGLGLASSLVSAWQHKVHRSQNGIGRFWVLFWAASNF